jgi:hypothetical protein
MKNTLKVLFTLFIVFALAQVASAQTTTTQTILSTAITNTSSNIVNVASATGITASTVSVQTYIFVDSELMQVRAISGTQLTVIRGRRGRASTHAANSVVFFGTAGTYNNATQVTGGVFIDSDPIGNCTANQQAFSLVVNPQTSSVWRCLNSAWAATTTVPLSDVVPVTTVTDAAYTASLVDTFIQYTSVTSARTVTLPSITGYTGKMIIVDPAAGGATAITVAAANGQFVGTVGTASLTTSNGVGGTCGSTKPCRLMSTSFSPVNSAGTALTVSWGWVTW